ncbi:hypothetical protein ANN_17871 [Periplaneta americana]|uniref:Carboxylesterase type B domain-containing protein n=1 Tax=Periplaneta americana TaxID=6978 RepID=A0ABQ8SU60_PERAM|nr:hypothetical protein ANN_17871 [Periplaneta americana]
MKVQMNENVVVHKAFGVIEAVARLPADPELRSSMGSIPAWADYLIVFFRGFPQPQFPDEWPSRSPDLNPCDFWLWGYLKDRVYQGNIRSLADLKASIQRMSLWFHQMYCDLRMQHVAEVEISKLMSGMVMSSFHLLKNNMIPNLNVPQLYHGQLPVKSAKYTDWEHLGDGYLNQRKIAEVVGDYFFICPTNLFAEQFAERGNRVYYYYFTQVLSSVCLCRILVPSPTSACPTVKASG